MEHIMNIVIWCYTILACEMDRHDQTVENDARAFDHCSIAE